MSEETTTEASPATDRITRWLLIAIGIYSALLVSFLNLLVLNSDNVKDRAIILMADGMIVLWIIVGGRTDTDLGITGSIAEASINPSSLIGGFWVYVYGLMVYLPACAVPQDRGAKRLKWWH